MINREMLVPLIFGWQYRLLDAYVDFYARRTTLGWTYRQGEMPVELKEMSRKIARLAEKMGDELAGDVSPIASLNDDDLAWLIRSFPICSWFRIACTVEWNKRGRPRLSSDFERCIGSMIAVAMGKLPRRHQFDGGCIPELENYAQHRSAKQLSSE